MVKYLILFAGAWNLVNGILHDIFVLIQRRPFEKELIRLLIDGNILIFSGIVLILCFFGMRLQQTFAFWIAFVTVISILAYCGLILKFLPSIGTILIHLSCLIFMVVELLRKGVPR